MTKDETKINDELLLISRDVFLALSELRPEHSFSFSLTEEGVEAMADMSKVVEWGIGGNKSKLKEVAHEVVSELENSKTGTPINVNFTEYELKAMGEIVEAIEKAIESNDGGSLK